MGEDFHEIQMARMFLDYYIRWCVVGGPVPLCCHSLWLGEMDSGERLGQKMMVVLNMLGRV